MPLAAFQQNWLLWMTPEWGLKSNLKIGLADRASPVGLVETLFWQVHLIGMVLLRFLIAMQLCVYCLLTVPAATVGSFDSAAALFALDPS